MSPPPEELPWRQVHLDFHTSPLIPDVARDFDADAFARTLRRARVRSVTCFSRCHHGMIYHDTRFTDLRHPGLRVDLLGLQIEACHAAGIRVPIYISVGWDDAQARRHPGWLERDPAGKAAGPGPLQAGFDRKLCLNSPYAEFVLQQTEEVLRRFPCDGFFFDIVYQGPCCCPRCAAGMRARGLDPADGEHRARFAAGVLGAFLERATALVRAHAPGASVFYNAGHVGPQTLSASGQMTHLEIESLPTDRWGYLHFPITARAARGAGLPLVGLTAAFHLSWGDFGGLKGAAALRYECLNMLAHGARCSVGDQLHPRGTLDPETYRRLGAVYAEVEALEPWCAGAAPLAEVGVFSPEAFAAADGLVDTAAAGAQLALAEGHQQFEFVGGEADLGRYRVLVIPDKIRASEALAASLSAYLAGGGALIASHLSLLRADADRFALPEVGARYEGPAEHCPDYLVAPGLLSGEPTSPRVMYERGARVRPLRGTQLLAQVWRPYFDRGDRAYCGHRQAPPDQPAPYPAVLQRGRLIYFAHPIFTMLRRSGAPWCQELLLAALGRLLPDPLVRAEAPGSCQITVLRQETPARLLMHLLHFVPRQRGLAFATVEEELPLVDVRLQVRTGPAPASATLAPSGQALATTHRPPYTELVVPRVQGHQLVVLQQR